MRGRLPVGQLPPSVNSRRPSAHSPGGAGRAGKDDWASSLRLSGAIVCRSVVFVGLSAFISLYARRRTGGR